MTTSTEDRIAALEQRLGAAEDELAIIRLIASYGPLVDSGSPDFAPSLMAPDGVYDVSYRRMTGREAFSDLLRSDQHCNAIRGGIAHVMGLPWVRVTGDGAIAINSTQLYLKDGERFTIFRVAQNLWRFSRTHEGWQITERVNRLIGNDGEARALLEGGIAEKSALPGEPLETRRQNP